MDKEQIAAAIKAQKWDKSSYAYAIHAMAPYNVKGCFPNEYKKQEIINEFYELCETRFDRIADFTTFKHLKPQQHETTSDKK